MLTKLSVLSFLFSALTTQSVFADGSNLVDQDMYTIELGAVGPLNTEVCADLKAAAVDDWKEKHHTRNL